jgi:NTP pyrophosphatase (non-canonical NTP hydrolase)
MLNDVEAKLKKLDVHFRKRAPEWSERERLLARVVKLNEEVGELCEAVLFENDSLQNHKQKNLNLDSELADVIIVTLLIALNREKNIWNEVDKKLNEIMHRFKT